MKKCIGFSVLLLCLSAYTEAQEKKQTGVKKGQFFVVWGWNREAYTNSKIRFKGDDYNFTLYSVKAKDRPTLPVRYNDYLKLSRITIPQTNFKMGYFFRENLSVNIGVDHMKYVMVKDQIVKMAGSISRNGLYKGNYNGPQKLTEDFLTYEHTDGLNYLFAGIEKYQTLYASKSEMFQVNSYYGGSLGVLMPKTNVRLLDYERNDRFHLSGYGLNATVGVQALIWRHLLLRFQGKTGFIHMPDIILHKTGIAGRASQHFFYAEADATIGFSCNLSPVKKKK